MGNSIKIRAWEEAHPGKKYRDINEVLFWAATPQGKPAVEALHQKMVADFEAAKAAGANAIRISPDGKIHSDLPHKRIIPPITKDELDRSVAGPDRPVRVEYREEVFQRRIIPPLTIKEDVFLPRTCPTNRSQAEAKGMLKDWEWWNEAARPKNLPEEIVNAWREAHPDDGFMGEADTLKWWEKEKAKREGKPTLSITAGPITDQPEVTEVKKENSLTAELEGGPGLTHTDPDSIIEAKDQSKQQGKKRNKR